jgi:DNA-binding MarR family transcriptional regulator
MTASLLMALVRHLSSGDDALTALPLAQLRVCGVLYGGPRPMSALGQQLGVSLSAVTQLADRLERARLVRRVADEADRRVKCLQLTERGQRLMRAREEARVRRLSAALERLPAEARSTVIEGLELLVRACGADRGQIVGPIVRQSV